ncbi:MAG: Mur ligase domain-containing protein, partial [Clostridia bacterium]
MKPMEIQEICQKAGARLWDGEGKERIHSVVTDSRKVEPGSLFIALKGERTDGHEYLEQALSQGAAAVMAQADYLGAHPLCCPAEKAILEVEHTGAALEELARVYRGQFELPLIGGTGSVG